MPSIRNCPKCGYSSYCRLNQIEFCKDCEVEHDKWHERWVELNLPPYNKSGTWNSRQSERRLICIRCEEIVYESKAEDHIKTCKKSNKSKDCSDVLKELP